MSLQRLRSTLGSALRGSSALSYPVIWWSTSLVALTGALYWIFRVPGLPVVSAAAVMLLAALAQAITLLLASRALRSRAADGRIPVALTVGLYVLAALVRALVIHLTMSWLLPPSPLPPAMLQGVLVFSPVVFVTAAAAMETLQRERRVHSQLLERVEQLRLSSDQARSILDRQTAEALEAFNTTVMPLASSLPSRLAHLSQSVPVQAHITLAQEVASLCLEQQQRLRAAVPTSVLLTQPSRSPRLSQALLLPRTYLPVSFAALAFLAPANTAEQGMVAAIVSVSGMALAFLLARAVEGRLARLPDAISLPQAVARYGACALPLLAFVAAFFFAAAAAGILSAVIAARALAMSFVLSVYAWVAFSATFSMAELTHRHVLLVRQAGEDLIALSIIDTVQARAAHARLGAVSSGQIQAHLTAALLACMSAPSKSPAAAAALLGQARAHLEAARADLVEMRAVPAPPRDCDMDESLAELREDWAGFLDISAHLSSPARELLARSTELRVSAASAVAACLASSARDGRARTARISLDARSSCLSLSCRDDGSAGSRAVSAELDYVLASAGVSRQLSIGSGTVEVRLTWPPC